MSTLDSSRDTGTSLRDSPLPKSTNKADLHLSSPFSVRAKRRLRARRFNGMFLAFASKSVMQIISAAPLVDKFRNDTFEPPEVGPYFMAYMILMAVMGMLSFGAPNAWDLAARLATVVITVFGLLYLKRQNRDTFGNDFLSRYFCLGWVTTVRMFLLTIPAAVATSALAVVVGGREAIAPALALLTIVFEVLYYSWLGSLFAQSNSANPTAPMPHAEKRPHSASRSGA